MAPENRFRKKALSAHDRRLYAIVVAIGLPYDVTKSTISEAMPDASKGPNGTG